jgi:hypothetical protein
MSRSPLFLSSVAALIFSAAVFAQGPPIGDRQAVVLAGQTISAMLGHTSIRDVTLTGTVTWDSADTGTITLKALGTGESRMDLALTSGTRVEIRDASKGAPQGRWIATNGGRGEFASHNTLTDAVWFFPALGSLARASKEDLTYIGRETRRGLTVEHVQTSVMQPRFPTNISFRQLSQMDFYLDATTLLPVATTFNTHPDNDLLNNLPVEVDFSDYRKIDGVVVPMRIQRYQQGNLMLEIELSGASFNTGLSPSDFDAN